MKKPVFHAFTRKFGGRTNVLFTDIKISEAFDPQTLPVQSRPPEIECKAIWDTGATSSCITAKLAQQIGLKPIGKTPVTNTSGTEIKDAYLVNIRLPNNVILTHLKVVECVALSGGFEFLIGMDIIGAGDFAVTNADNKTTLSYRLPSIKTIDYVEQANIQNAQPRTSKLTKRKIKEKRKKERLNRKKGRKSRGKKK